MMSELTRVMLANWRPGLDVNIHSEFSELTSAIALKTLFGLDNPGDREEFVESLRLAFDLLSQAHQRRTSDSDVVPDAAESAAPIAQSLTCIA